jgi:hypothetical protein
VEAAHYIVAVESLVQCERTATTTPNDVVAVSVCLNVRITGKLLVIQMAESTLIVPSCKTADERGDDDEHAAMRSSKHGTPLQELRVALHLLLPRLEHQNCYHAKREEMSGLQEIEGSGKRTLPS